MSQRKSISKATRLKVYEKYCGHCAYCGCKLELKEMQVDHIQSVYWYNGANDIENYNPACRMCNFYKSTMTVDDFRKQLGTLLLRLEKVFIFRLAKKYGLIKEMNEPVVFYFEKKNKTDKGGVKKMTNYEKIKSMSKEQMTQFMLDIMLDTLNSNVCHCYCENCDAPCLGNEEIIRKWLESEADSD